MDGIHFCWLALALLSGIPASGQKVRQNGVAIRELSRPEMNAMLTTVPRTDAARCDRLRLGGLDKRLAQMAASPAGAHR